MKTTPDIARADIGRVVDLVADAYGIETSAMLSRSRTRHYARARNLAARIMRDALDATMAEIGEALGRHHTTIIHSISRADEMISSDKWTRDIAGQIQRRILVERQKRTGTVAV